MFDVVILQLGYYALNTKLGFQPQVIHCWNSNEFCFGKECETALKYLSLNPGAGCTISSLLGCAVIQGAIKFPYDNDDDNFWLQGQFEHGLMMMYSVSASCMNHGVGN